MIFEGEIQTLSVKPTILQISKRVFVHPKGAEAAGHALVIFLFKVIEELISFWANLLQAVQVDD